MTQLRPGVVGWLAAVLCAWLLAGCAAMMLGTPGRSATPPPAGTTVGDAALQERVLNALQADSTLVVRRLAVSVRAGVVTLSGEVPGYAERLQAGNVAARVPGVATVRNRITVFGAR